MSDYEDDEQDYQVQEVGTEGALTLADVMADTKKDFGELLESFDRLKPLIAPEGDFKIIQQAEDTLNEQHKRRQREQERAVAELDSLSKTLSEARRAALRPPTAPTEEEHDANVAHLEADQLTKGKQLNDQQHTTTKKVEQLDQLKKEHEEAKARDVEREVNPNTKAATQIKFYADMGIKLVSKPEGESILFYAENDVDQVNIDKDGSAFFQTNTLWNKANSVFP